MSRYDFKSGKDLTRTATNNLRQIDTVLTGFSRGTAGHSFVRGRTFRSITASASHEDGDDYILADATSAAVTYTLPLAVTGVQIDIKKTDSSSNAVIIDGSGAETIDGATTATLGGQYDSVTVSSDETSWHIV